ncbi:MAG: tRNA (adenosine(37)-N6)-dimethylallyltransferase MiaA [Chloroflexi bacterium]|nr:tRNA (adenosine(37)-N6)-dimethylallyltransferase MiaA [Chloroflexota bacterium]
MSPLPDLPLILLLGPTAAGKTETALSLAERFAGEIISADSRTFYRGLDIGSAKPTPAEMQRVPHHLIDVADPDETWSLALFQQEARRAINAIHARGRLPFLVGGTGQYLRAVAEDWQPPRALPDPRLRQALEAWAVEVAPAGLHARLARLDPAAAAAIDPRNLRRTVRALEVILATGERFSTQRRQGAAPYRLLQIGLTRPRAELYPRIDARIAAMLQAGWLQEAQRLLDRGYSPALPSLSAIGYREIIAHLQGRLSLEEAVTRIKRQTRVFVRRQANWFKLTDPLIHWFTPTPSALDAISTLIQSFLSTGSPPLQEDRDD